MIRQEEQSVIIYKLSTDPATGAPAYEKVDTLPPGAAVALGNFDGVHRGHQRLFTRAKEAGCPVSAAWSFTSLAKAVNPAPALTDIQSKLRLFAACGLDYAILEDFETIRSMTPAVFAMQYLPDQIRAGSVVCGFNFRFGKGGTGDADALRKYLAGVNIPVIVENPVLCQNRIVSSSAIRGCILDGNMESASELLGHPFSICFPVVRGKQFGRTIGIPTINQSFPKGHIIPRGGIYACTCNVGGDIFLGVANIGVRPTVTDGNVPVNCETHIIDYNGLLYGKEIQVEFYHRLRDEIRFENVQQLKNQVQQDIQKTIAYFEATYGG